MSPLTYLKPKSGNFLDMEFHLLQTLLSWTTYVKPATLCTIYCYLSPFFDFKRFRNLKKKLGLAIPATNQFDLVNFLFYINSKLDFSYHQDLGCLSYTIIFAETENMLVLETIAFFEYCLRLTTRIRNSSLYSNYHNLSLLDTCRSNFYHLVLGNFYEHDFYEVFLFFRPSQHRSDCCSTLHLYRSHAW